MIIDVLSLYINLIEKLIDIVEGKKRREKVLKTPLGETLTKVETAQEHLTDAIEAIDIIRKQVILERTQLDTLLLEVENKKALAVIIGGDNDVFDMEHELIKDELDDIFEKFPDYLKYVTTSRRTSPQIEALVNEYEFDYKLIYSKEPTINPIGDFIAVCDEFFITADSTSMLSEVRANSQAKINIIDLDSKKENTKFHRLADIIEEMDEQKVNFAKLLKKVKI